MAQRERITMLLGPEVDVARRHREMVRLAHDRHWHDLDVEIHPLDRAQLMEILLAKKWEMRFHNVEQLGNHCGDAAKVPRTALAAKTTRKFRDLNPGLRARPIHRDASGAKTTSTGTDSISAQLRAKSRGYRERSSFGTELRRVDRLPYSAEEVRGIMSVFGIRPDSGSVYLGCAATKKALLGLDLSQYRTLHFATHAVMGDQVKWITQPALIFSPDGSGVPDNDVLKMSEIFNLRLNADLVVLSACETARGKLSRGEGIVGLTSAFLFAGSRSVVASLWNVNDESASLSMESFYRGLKRGLSKPEALRQARLETMQKRIKSALTGEEKTLASPYFWAPFVLIGEWN